MKRREFVKTGMLASSGVFFIDSFLGCINPEITTQKYFEGFQNPPEGSRVFVRWWWNSNRLDKNEILRELDVMKAAGIGGVEINPIAYPDIGDPAGYAELTKGYKVLPTFSDEWLKMVHTALTGAKERGLVCDLLVGSGWPFGGEFLDKEDQIQIVTIETIDLEGGKVYNFSIDELIEKVVIHNHYKNEPIYKELLSVRLVPKVMNEFAAGEELINSIVNGKLTINPAEGDQVLYYIVKVTGYMRVIRGVEGAAGPVLNHYNKQAVEKYLNKVSGLINGITGSMGNFIRAAFVDSMELEGANWNDDVPVEFEKRRGYSLWPYLPFILKKKGTYLSWIRGVTVEEYGSDFSEDVQELLKRVDLDFHNTLLELWHERFIDPFTEWCKENGVKSRVQAYGPGYHPLESSMKVDIPEGETWIRNEVGNQFPSIGLTGRSYKMINKYVASAAAIAGKMNVTCEEMTNTSVIFMTSLEKVKISGDQGIVSGMKQSVLHGFNYSPPELPFPGWVRYGTFFSELNTWWPWFRQWADYKARITYLLQNAVLQSNIAILQPTVDIALKMGPEYMSSVNSHIYPEYQNNLWEVIHQNGDGCDYVSENLINSSSFTNGSIKYNSRSWQTLILPELETLSPETVNSLFRFAEAGGRIIFIGKVPFKSAYFEDARINDDAVKAGIDELISNSGGNVIVCPSPGSNLREWYGDLQKEAGIEPFIKFNRTDKFLNQCCYDLEGNPLFFLANTSLSEHIQVKAEFMVDRKLSPVVWDPETGQRLLYPVSNPGNILDINLSPASSLLIIFEKYQELDKYPVVGLKSAGKTVTGPWQLNFFHINGSSVNSEVENLTDLIDDPLTKEFAGEVIYKTTIDLDHKDYKYMDLGRVEGITELSVNGVKKGTKWYGDHLYEVSGSLKAGENFLEIKLTTILGNYMKSLPDNIVARQFTSNQSWHSMGVLGPVRIF